MMRQIFAYLFLISLLTQLACTVANVRVTRAEAAQNPLTCALYAARVAEDAEAVSQVAIKYAEAGEFVRALEIIDSLPERGFIGYSHYGGLHFRPLYVWNIITKIRTYADVAILQAQAGQVEDALKNLERSSALALLPELDEDEYRNTQLTLIASKFVLLGREERAFSIFHRLPTISSQANGNLHFPRARMLRTIAENLVQRGKREEGEQMLVDALRELEQIPPPDIFGEEVSKIADVYTKVGNVGKAIHLIQTFATKEQAQLNRDASSKAWNLMRFSEKLVEFGMVPEGIRLAESISDPMHQARALAAVACQLAKTKNYATAVAIIKNTPASALVDVRNAREEIAKRLLDEGHLGIAFEIIDQIESNNNKASVLAYAARIYAARGEHAKARELATKAFQGENYEDHGNGFVDSVVQYLLLVDKSAALERLKVEGTKRGAGWALAEVAQKLSHAQQDVLAIEVLKYIQAEDYIEDAGPVTIRAYRAGAIGKIALHYYDSKRPADARLQATLAEFVKLLD